jgi:cytoskeletal protein CcmA (bactofilin family)
MENFLEPIKRKLAVSLMIFKRNAKGLLERETKAPLYHSLKETDKEVPNKISTGSDQSATNIDKQEHSNRFIMPSSQYPQEDFPVLKSAEISSNEIKVTDTPQIEAAELPETVLGEGVSFKGELSFQRYLCINGEFEGALRSSGKLRVGKSGWVKSDLKLRSAVIEGRVDGDIHVEDLLELRGTAKVEGNITARYLRVDDGVTLIGHVLINPEGKFEDEEEINES